MANINVKVNPVTTTSVAIGASSNKVKQVAIGQVSGENIDLNDLRNVDTTTVVLDTATPQVIMYNANAASGGTAGFGALHFGANNTDQTLSFSSEL